MEGRVGPLFPGDLDHDLTGATEDEQPEGESALRIVASDGVLLVTPEYNNGIPGVFKNTIVRGPVGYTIDEETRKEIDRLRPS